MRRSQEYGDMLSCEQCYKAAASSIQDGLFLSKDGLFLSKDGLFLSGIDYFYAAAVLNMC